MDSLPNNTSSLPTAYLPGTHVLLDFWCNRGLSDLDFIRDAMIGAAEACGATVLNVMLHQFGEELGVTGVALLAESHISIHTWPETGYAALDIFLCGNCDPEQAIAHLTERFEPSRTRITYHPRGDVR